MLSADYVLLMRQNEVECNLAIIVNMHKQYDKKNKDVDEDTSNRV